MYNSLATFQAMMDSIFTDLIEKGYVIVHMDNILIFAKTKDLLKEYTRLVLQQLWEHDLYLQPKKCEFEKEKIKYLGMIVQ